MSVPPTFRVPFTVRVLPGLVVPMPTLPVVGARMMLPVEALPRVKVCMAVVAMVGVPYKVNAPETEAELAMVVVPVAAPRLRAVAAPAKLTVVAVVLSRAKVVEGVVKLVVMAGEVPKTATRSRFHQTKK